MFYQKSFNLIRHERLFDQKNSLHKKKLSKGNTFTEKQITKDIN